MREFTAFFALLVVAYLLLLFLALVDRSTACHVIPSSNQIVFAHVYDHQQSSEKSNLRRSHHAKRFILGLEESMISNKRLVILSHFHSSFYSLPDEIVKLYEKSLIPAAIQYWENSLSLKYPHSPLHLGRFCSSNNSDSSSKNSAYCKSDCSIETRCGDYIPIPEDHLDICHFCSKDGSNCRQKGIRHKGVNADFILYISSVDSEHCRVSNTVAFSSYCQLESKYSRPVAGYINICPKSVSAKKSDIHGALATLKHEILHSLGFSVGLFAFFVDKNGNPLTPRDPLTGKPPYNKNSHMHEPSDRIVKTVTRKNWKIGSGYIDRNVTLLVTPRVKAEVRKHFNCSSLEGAELEDQGETGTRLTHWEKRIFEQEAMTGTYTQNSVFSRITFAFLEDTGWYNVNYSNAEELRWGQNLGCEFAVKSCKHWIDSRAARNESIRPYCNQISDSHRYETLKYECDDRKEAVMLCNLMKHNHALPPEYQNFNSSDHIEYTRRHKEKHGADEQTAQRAANHLGGSVLLADFCPFMQQVSWSMNGEVRDSKCTIDENQPSDKAKNYILEEYGTQSKCFLHEREWSVYTDRCTARITVAKTVGCYQYACDQRQGLMVKVHDGYVRCPAGKVNKVVNFTAITSNRLKTMSMHYGNLICPACEDLCGNTIDCSLVPSGEDAAQFESSWQILSPSPEKGDEQQKLCHEELRNHPIDSSQSDRIIAFRPPITFVLVAISLFLL